MCPSSRASAQGNPCSPDGARCSVENGLVCVCSCQSPGSPVGRICTATDPKTWYCEAPNPNPSCPPALPNLGTACSSEGLSCAYACGNGSRVCSDGVWVKGRYTPCPVSVRRAKRDIRYLDESELARIAVQIEHMKLARFHYIDPALSRREQLGFIIEDSPTVAAVDREHEMVDLYGYASMLAATTQVQAKQIRALRREVEALKKRVR